MVKHIFRWAALCLPATLFLSGCNYPGLAGPAPTQRVIVATITPQPVEEETPASEEGTEPAETDGDAADEEAAEEEEPTEDATAKETEEPEAEDTAGFNPLVILPFDVSSAETADVIAERAVMLSLTNEARVNAGLAPYLENERLNKAAMLQSLYQSSIQEVTHVGPERLEASELRAVVYGYQPTWTNENVFRGLSGFDAVNWWLTADSGHISNMLHPIHREVGFGIATGENGLKYYTMIISAQTDSIPIFINDGESGTTTPDVVLTLSNEFEELDDGTLDPRYTSIKVSNVDDFEEADEQPWQQQLDWKIDARRGEQFVYVQFIDEDGETTKSQTSIELY